MTGGALIHLHQAEKAVRFRTDWNCEREARGLRLHSRIDGRPARVRQLVLEFRAIVLALHTDIDSRQRLLIEYKPFEPAFYHTDIADWGMALAFARSAGPGARVLVDTGHHYQSRAPSRGWCRSNSGST